GPKTHLIRESLPSLEARRDRIQCLRSHRSAFVNVDRIVRVEAVANRDLLATLNDYTSVRASRTYSKTLKSLLQNKAG
ncbi:MAG: LytTR family DNA-binding domain-containing protein, partial [Acidobacteriaceae bacterium]